MITLHEFVPVTNSGEVTLESGARFLHAGVSSDGSQRIGPGPGPLDGRWPSIRLSVAAGPAPADHQITLQRAGTQVQIDAPLAARAHLYYKYTITCPYPVFSELGANLFWEPISRPVVQKPDCGDSGSQSFEWSYAVSAPGYAIASGQMHG